MLLSSRFNVLNHKPRLNATFFISFSLLEERIQMVLLEISGCALTQEDIPDCVADSSFFNVSFSSFVAYWRTTQVVVHQRDTDVICNICELEIWIQNSLCNFPDQYCATSNPRNPTMNICLKIKHKNFPKKREQKINSHIHIKNNCTIVYKIQNIFF
jgi:hypothetical protein